MEIKHFAQNSNSTEINFSSKRKLFNYLILAGLVVILIAGIFYYLRYYRERNLYPDAKVSVDEKRYQDLGFKKINAKDGKSSYFIPEEWTDIDLELDVYGDVLSGANVYLQRYPNNLGVLNSDTCKEFSSQSYKKFSETKTYSNSSLVDSKIVKTGNYEVCELNIDASLGGRDFSVKQRYVFLKNQIHQIYLQLPKDMAAHDEKENLILESVSIED